MATFGTLTTYDTLPSRFQFANMTVAEYGEQRAAEGVQKLLDAHNATMRNILSDLAGWTDQRLMMYGTGSTGQMQEMDELGTPSPQKNLGGSVVGFPLRKFAYAWQGTRQYFKKATVADLLVNAGSMQDADYKGMINEIRKAIFVPTNYTFEDYLVDHLTATPLPVKRLVNADGLAIPPGPNGEYYDPTTHTHYLGTSSLATSDVVALKDTVLEHYENAEGIIAINRAQENTVRGMTPNFVALLPGMITGPTTAAQANGLPLNVSSVNNRQIGEFDGVPVWIKPWVPASYLVMYARAGAGKVCLIRTDVNTTGGGNLAVDYNDETYPLRAQAGGREFGVGVYERTGAAVLYTGNSTYTAPTLSTY